MQNFLISVGNAKVRYDITEHEVGKRYTAAHHLYSIPATHVGLN